MRVAFAVQRYGLEVNGGAELLCRQVAERMAGHWDVEVLTSCAVDYATWQDSYPPGLGEVNGVPVRRFRVDFPRSAPVFDRLCATVFSGQTSPELEARWAYEQGPYSSEYLHFLDDQSDRYDMIVFVTYQYATTFYGLPRVTVPRVLAPMAHDEPSFHLQIYQQLFKDASALLFNTPEEQDMVLRGFDLETPSWVAGVGIEAPSGDAERFRKQLGVEGPYLLYLGRIDESKGCAEMFDHFARFRQAHADQPLQLLLLGKAVMPIPEHPEIRHLGFVSDQTKFDALAGTQMLIAPSPYESLSIAALEAWTQRTPVLANGNCAVLVGQCKRSGGGLCYTDYASFESGLLGCQPERGQAGQAYVAQHYTWDAVEQAYLDCAAQLVS